MSRIAIHSFSYLLFSMPACAWIVPNSPIDSTRRSRNLADLTSQQQQLLPPTKRSRLSANIYDDWRSDAVVDTMPLDEDNVRACLKEFVESDYGKQMFGCHDLPASYGITGSIDFVEVDGPAVILTLDGEFWHRRETVLGRAAMWLNARMPEIVEVNVEDATELQDFEKVLDENGEVLYVNDKRSDDFNGDRGTVSSILVLAALLKVCNFQFHVLATHRFLFLVFLHTDGIPRHRSRCARSVSTGHWRTSPRWLHD
jgi:hypothetical protein